MRLKDKYTGRIAAQYEAKRIGSEKWDREQRAVERFIAQLSGTVLDIPVGTGRFLSCYAARGLIVIGIDSSGDMLALAKRKGLADARLGDILDIGLPDGSVDSVVCVRMLNWFEPPDAAKAISEIARVTRDAVVLSVTTGEEHTYTKPNGAVIHNESDLLACLEVNRLGIVAEKINTDGPRKVRVILLRKNGEQKQLSCGIKTSLVSHSDQTAARGIKQTD